MNSKQLWFIVDVGEGNNQCLINKPFQIKLQLQQIRNLNYFVFTPDMQFQHYQYCGQDAKLCRLEL